MYAKYGKRIVDLVLASIGAIVLFLPLLIVAIIIKLDSTGPVFFKQPRYGKDKKPFTVYKFRTFTASASSDPATNSKATNSFRDSNAHITRAGKVLRKLSIDELPQIINVFRGEMSIVGPRPVVLAEKELIRERSKYRANSVKPGITGWAQVNGRDELDDIIKARMDGYYVENFGFITDLKCLLKTIVVIVTAAGHSEGHEQAEENKQQLESASE